MSTRLFARLLGAALLLGAVCGFVPQLLASGAEIHPLSLDTQHDQLFSLFPVNPLDNIVHAGLGLWGLFASRSHRLATRFARWMAGILLALTFGGFVPAFGDILPLYGNDIWLHALLALTAAYFGWVHRSAPDPALTRPDPAGVDQPPLP